MKSSKWYSLDQAFSVEERSVIINQTVLRSHWRIPAEDKLTSTFIFVKKIQAALYKNNYRRARMKADRKIRKSDEVKCVIEQIPPTALSMVGTFVVHLEVFGSAPLKDNHIVSQTELAVTVRIKPQNT